MAAPRLLVQQYADVTVVSFTESTLLDSRSIEAIAEALYRLADELNKRKIILDLSDVKFLASQALGVILALQQKVTRIKGTLALCGVRKEIMKVFKITKLDKMLKFYPDDSAALKSFGVMLA